jgi:hypothetical protein
MWSLGRDLFAPAATLTFGAELCADLVAARTGDKDAMYRAAVAYRTERGTPYDGMRAYYWMARAFRRRHMYAYDTLMAWLQAAGVYWVGFKSGAALSFWAGADKRWPPGFPAPVFPGLECPKCSVCKTVCACDVHY